MTNKKENKNTVQSNDAAGFGIQANGELSNTQPTDPNVTTFNVGPEVPNNEDYTGESLVKQINEAPDNITIDSTKVNLSGDVAHIKSPITEVAEDDDFEKLVKETINGVHGSGRERMISLGANYAKVQQEVNRRLFR